MRFARWSLVAALGVATPLWSAPPALAQNAGNERTEVEIPPSVLPEVERVVVVGSVRGHVDRLRTVLVRAGLIDQNDNWIGGEAHLVQLGELFGQGPSLTGAVELLMSLEKQAEAAGGDVQSLQSPSDFAVLRGRFDNIAVFGEGVEQRYAKYVTADSEEKRQKWVDKFMAEQAEFNEGEPTFERLRLDFQRNLDMHFKLGAAEFLESIAPGTEMGDWLRARNTIIRIGDTVYSYAGASELVAITALEEVNDEIRDKVDEITVWFPVMRDKTNPIWWVDMVSPAASNMDIRLPWIQYQLGARSQVISMVDKPRPYREGRVIHLFSGIDRPDAGVPMVWVEKDRGAFYIHSGGRTSDPWEPDPLPEIPPPAPPGVPLPPVNGDR
jgi:hypothetical protein